MSSTGEATAGRLAADPVLAARSLLGAVLVGRSVSAEVVEVEAYGGRPTAPGPMRRRIRFGVPACVTR